MYFEEMPKYGDILGIEKEMNHSVQDVIDGHVIQSPLPFKGFVDLVYREKGKIIIEDYKFVTAHSDPDQPIHPNYWTQSMFYYYLAREEYKEEPVEIRFREVKLSKNKDGSSQHNVIIINFLAEEFALQKSFFWYQFLGMMKMIEEADQDTFMMYNTFDLLN